MAVPVWSVCLCTQIPSPQDAGPPASKMSLRTLGAGLHRAPHSTVPPGVSQRIGLALSSQSFIPESPSQPPVVSLTLERYPLFTLQAYCPLLNTSCSLAS